MSDAATLERLRQEIARLRDIAKAEGLPTLAYLLEMALLEAKTAARIEKPPK